jgi:hypothetical protein
MKVAGVRGLPLGLVEAVEDDCFLVRAAASAGGDALWLRTDAIFTIEDGEVTLVCTTPQWKKYECNHNGHAHGA